MLFPAVEDEVRSELLVPPLRNKIGKIVFWALAPITVPLTFLSLVGGAAIAIAAGLAVVIIGSPCWICLCARRYKAATVAAVIGAVLAAPALLALAVGLPLFAGGWQLLAIGTRVRGLPKVFSMRRFR